MAKKPNIAHNSSANLACTFKIINYGPNTFGYDILDHENVLIHQLNIPAIQGNRGFASKYSAEKTARLAILKITNHIMPPTISIHELDSMHINYKKN